MIEIKDISVQYKNKSDKNRNLGPLSLQVENGETCTIIGPSGCGKTTLMRILAGVVTDFKGSVKINGSTLNPIQNKIAYIPSNYGLFNWKTIKANCLLPINIRKLPSNKVTLSRFNELVEKFNIVEILDRYPTQLNIEQLLRVAIVRSLVVKPDVLLMDEPFSYLKASSREIAWRSLKNVMSNYKISTLLTTHSIEEALFLGDRVIVLSGGSGKVIADITAMHSMDYKYTSSRYIKLASIIKQLIKEEWRENKDEKNTCIC